MNVGPRIRVGPLRVIQGHVRKPLQQGSSKTVIYEQLECGHTEVFHKTRGKVTFGKTRRRCIQCAQEGRN